MNTTDYPNCVDKNKFEKMLTTIYSNKFNYKNKIGEFIKYIGIKDLVNNIRNNTISEINAKKNLFTLIRIKKAEIIKYEKRTSTQKELLNLFNDLLKTILTDKILMPSKDDVNDNDNDNENENENENGNNNDNDNDNDNENDNGNNNENENDSENKNDNDNMKKKENKIK